MAYNYLGLVNDCNKRLNEVALTTTDFAATTGYYSFVKDSVNSYANCRYKSLPFSRRCKNNRHGNV